MARLDLMGIATTETDRFVRVERTPQDFINLVFSNNDGVEFKITVYDGTKPGLAGIVIPHGKEITFVDELDEVSNNLVPKIWR
tara:strand:- start:2632 stop:2880 length:249 start_codon:yes stop_codon:yes gene_type:complete